MEAVHEMMKFHDLDVDQIAFELESGLFDFDEHRKRLSDMLSTGLENIGFEEAPLWHYNDNLPQSHAGTQTGEQTIILDCHKV